MNITRFTKRDARWIYPLVLDQLVPYSHTAKQGQRPPFNEIRSRLSSGITYVIRNRSRVGCGFIHVIRQGEWDWIDMLAVRPEDQGLGCGSKLLQTVKRACGRRGCSSLNVFVDRSNQRALGFYMKHGFTVIRYEHSIDCYRMVWEVS